MEEGFRGHCYCGRIQFTIDADVQPNKPVYCHCESCRRAHASPLYQVCYIPTDAFHITNGFELLKPFSKSELGVIRSFCSNCGTRVCNSLPSKPSLGVGFFPALLEETIQHNLPEKFKPIYHYLAEESVLDMSVIHDGLERR